MGSDTATSWTSTGSSWRRVIETIRYRIARPHTTNETTSLIRQPQTIVAGSTRMRSIQNRTNV